MIKNNNINITLLCLLLFSPLAVSSETVNICKYDYSEVIDRSDIMFDKLEEALTLGLGKKVSKRTYLDPNKAASDFEKDKCDAVLIDSRRAKKYVPFLSSFDILGFDFWVPFTRAVFGNFKKAYEFTINGKFNALGVAPVDRVFLVSKVDFDDNDDFKNKRMGVLPHDLYAHFFVDRLKTIPIKTEHDSILKALKSDKIELVLLTQGELASIKDNFKKYSGAMVHKRPLTNIYLNIVINTERIPYYTDLRKELTSRYARHFGAKTYAIQLGFEYEDFLRDDYFLQSFRGLQINGEEFWRDFIFKIHADTLNKTQMKIVKTGNCRVSRIPYYPSCLR